MRSNDVALIVGLLSVSLAGCADRTPNRIPSANNQAAVAAIEIAKANLEEQSSYHIDATVTSSSSQLKSGIDGEYKIDFQKPDTHRSIRMVAGREVSRTIVVSKDIFDSSDAGKSWTQVLLPQGSPPRTITVVELLDKVCFAQRRGASFQVGVETKKRSCKAPLLVRVRLQGGRIREIDVNTKTDLGNTRTKATFVLGSPIEPIMRPQTT